MCYLASIHRFRVPDLQAHVGSLEGSSMERAGVTHLCCMASLRNESEGPLKRDGSAGGRPDLQLGLYSIDPCWFSERMLLCLLACAAFPSSRC